MGCLGGSRSRPRGEGDRGTDRHWGDGIWWMMGVKGKGGVEGRCKSKDKEKEEG